MMHPERDQYLLLLAHNQLSPVRRLEIEWHLRGCPDCRRRLSQFRAVSHAFADAIRGPQSLHWQPAAAVTSAAAVWILGGIMLMLLLAGGLALREHDKVIVPISPAGGCRPDLPNDRCR